MTTRTTRPYQRTLTLAEAARMTRDQLVESRRNGFPPPMAGGDGDGDGDGSGDAGSGDGDGDGDGDGGDGSGDGDGDGDAGDGDGDGSGDGDGGDDDPATLRAERDRAKAAAAKANREARQAQRELENRKQKDRESQGEYQKLYEESQKENEQLRSELKTRELKRDVVSQAASMGFKNPEMALTLVIKDLDDAVDDDGEVDKKAVERALNALAKSDEYLVEKKKPQGARRDGDKGGKDRRDRTGDSDGSGTRHGSENGSRSGMDLSPDDEIAAAYANSTPSRS